MTQNLAVMRIFFSYKLRIYCSSNVLDRVDVKCVRVKYAAVLHYIVSTYRLAHVSHVISRDILSSPGSVMSRLAVVCGGSRGIGRAVSHLLAQRGCRLAVVSRNKDAARTAVASLHGGKCRNDIFPLY